LTFRQELIDHAAERGILLLPGTEITAEGCHVLVINPGFRVSPGRTYKLVDLPKLRTPDSLFVAPHPYFAVFQSLRGRLRPLLPHFDAIEFASYYSRLVDFNRRGVRDAAAAGKPLLGTSDCHTFRQFGWTYSMIDAEKKPAAIIAAVKAGRLEVRTSPMSLAMMAMVILDHFSVRKLVRLLGR
jgi:hypothetical protein